MNEPFARGGRKLAVFSKDLSIRTENDLGVVEGAVTSGILFGAAHDNVSVRASRRFSQSVGGTADRARRM